MHSELIGFTTGLINENGLKIQIIFELLIFFVVARKTGICDSNLLFLFSRLLIYHV